MTNRELVIRYLEAFCAGDIEAIAELLAPDLRFKGPFHEYHRAQDYLAGLRADPPETASYHLLSVTEDAENVAVFYAYRKDEGTRDLAQLFRFRNGRIGEILLIFDGR